MKAMGIISKIELGLFLKERFETKEIAVLRKMKEKGDHHDAEYISLVLMFESAMFCRNRVSLIAILKPYWEEIQKIPDFKLSQNVLIYCWVESRVKEQTMLSVRLCCIDPLHPATRF